MLKRFYDIVIALIAIIILIIPSFIISFFIKITSSGKILYWSKRSGQCGKLFMMPKFTTMKPNTPEVATDKLLCSDQYITTFGSFLRHSSLDEIPQFFSILKGDMSLVGPRPALHNQHEVIAKRKELGIDILKPGITGLAQINGRDKISLEKKIEYDFEYLQKQSMLFDLKIILKTIITVVKQKNISH